MKMFIPITKVNESQRIVYGIATAETPDKSGEICDYESTKPFYKEWSDSFAKVTDGKSMGNLRVIDRKSTRLNSSHVSQSRMPSSA